MTRAVPHSIRKHGAGMIPAHVDGSDGSGEPPCREVDPEIMFPVPGGPTRLVDAKRVCRRCPLDKRSACLAWALDTRQDFGVWGGMSQGERRKELKRRDAAAAKVSGPEIRTA